VIIAIIGALGAVANAIISLIGSRRSEESHAKNSKAINVLISQTNGLSAKFAEVTGEKEYARGLKEGQQEALNPEQPEDPEKPKGS